MPTDKQLFDLTDEADQLHHESLRPSPGEADDTDIGGDLSPRGSRRRFLTKIGVGGAAVGIGTVATPLARFMPEAWAQAKPLDDGSIVKYAMTLEYAAVETYQVAATGKKLSAPRAELAQMFARHHQDHGDGFAALIKATDADKVPNKKVLAAFAPRLSGAADEKAVLEVLYSLEEALAATHLFTIGAFADKRNAGVTATVLPVESQHAVVLAQALGKPIAQFMPPFETPKAALDPAANAS